MRIPSFVFGWLVVGICCAAGADSARGLQLTDAFVSGADGYHTYRIPALLVTSKGTLLAFCEGRKGGRSDTGDIDLLVKRSADGGRTWSRQQIVWDDGANTCGNPCPVVDRTTGAIWLPMTWNPAHAEPGQRRGMTVRMSEDEGKTWPVSRVLWPGAAAYSCLAVLPGGDIARLFEAGEEHPYQRIILARFSRDWLTGADAPP